jgi:hypothetical protein
MIVRADRPEEWGVGPLVGNGTLRTFGHRRFYRRKSGSSGRVCGRETHRMFPRRKSVAQAAARVRKHQRLDAGDRRQPSSRILRAQVN